MLQSFLKELEKESFDEEQFVERLAWRTVDSFNDDGTGSFDPHIMYDTFVQTIKDLEILQERQRKKCENLEQICQEEEKSNSQDIATFQERNKSAVILFHDLDERINFVATKVIHLGDQLENINSPRSRAVEAQKLMMYFAEFLSPGPVLADVFMNKEELFEAADIIQKLHMIAQELPSTKFKEARTKISLKYDEIEMSLIDEFVKSYGKEDKNRMKEIASILSHFKSYSRCMDAFIEESQMRTFTGKDIFKELLPLTEKNFSLMKEVFNSPEQVMAKFVLNIYLVKVQNHVIANLSNKSDTDKYLENLMDLYTKTLQLSKDFSCFRMGTEDTYLSKLTHTIFQKFLDSYISTEKKALSEKCSSLLGHYYDSKDHQKKDIQSGSSQTWLQFTKRDLQAVIGTRANINIANIEDYGGETFLSEEIASAILQESKTAFRRCKVLSRPSELASNAFQILEVVLTQLFNHHVDYAIELGLNAIPIPETKTTQLDVYFFDVVRRTNIIVHMIERHFTECVLPLVASTTKHGECLLKKKYILSQIELKLDCGIDRSLNAIVGWIKIYLQTEQKKNDFKPDNDLDILQHPTLSSQACLGIIKFVKDNIAVINKSLDGRNREYVMNEFGARFHRVIYEHLQMFQYNSTGAMCVICDINEYRKCARELKSNTVNILFDILHALCNLLLVKPENLNEMRNGEDLAVLDGSIVLNFIQLRSDYKTQRLATFLKGIAT